MRRRLLSVLVLLVLPECSPSNIIHGFGQYYDCPEDNVTVDHAYAKELGTNGYWVSGCGKRAVYTCQTSGACASPQIMIAKRHGREFACDSHQVNVKYLEAGAWKASGCGHDTTYQCADSDEFILRCFAETTDRDRKELDTGAGN